MARRHPAELVTGSALRGFEELGMSGNALALELRVPVNRVNVILAGKRGITADTALRLAATSIPSLSFA